MSGAWIDADAILLDSEGNATVTLKPSELMEHVAAHVAAEHVALTSMIEEFENFEWQSPCETPYDKGYARGYENALIRAAADLRERFPA